MQILLAVCMMHPEKTDCLASPDPSNLVMFPQFWKRRKKILEASVPPKALGNQRERNFS
jgi:hypothetical protein